MIEINEKTHTWLFNLFNKNYFVFSGNNLVSKEEVLDRDDICLTNSKYFEKFFKNKKTAKLRDIFNYVYDNDKEFKRYFDAPRGDECSNAYELFNSSELGTDNENASHDCHLFWTGLTGKDAPSINKKQIYYLSKDILNNLETIPLANHINKIFNQQNKDLKIEAIQKLFNYTKFISFGEEHSNSNYKFLLFKEDNNNNITFMYSLILNENNSISLECTTIVNNAICEDYTFYCNLYLEPYVKMRFIELGIKKEDEFKHPNIIQEYSDDFLHVLFKGFNISFAKYSELRFENFSDEYIKNFLYCIDKILLFEFFLSHAEVQTEIKNISNTSINTKNLSKIEKEKLSNIPITVINKNYFTTTINNHDYPVRGHFRLQPIGEKRTGKKLIWINDFVKHQYIRVAKKLKEDVKK